VRQLTSHLRDDERGIALVTALLSTVVMLALGLALLAIVDTQTSQSASERTRDRGFNLSESVLNSEAFVLGRNWAASQPAGNPACAAASAGFADTLGSTGITAAGLVPTTTGNAQPGAAQAGTTSAATTRLRANLDASYTDSAYANATWQVNICDNVVGKTVWNGPTLLAQPAWDANGDNKVWVRAQSTVAGKTRTLVGLVQVNTTTAVDPKYGLIAGNVSQDLGPAASTITNTQVLTNVTSGLLNTGSPTVAADAAYPSPASGVTGVRCGLLDNISQVKTCVTGAIGALSQVPLVNNLVTQGTLVQYPYVSSSSANTTGQLRTQAQSTGGVYMETAPGSSTADSNTPSCGITGATSSSVVFIEKVGTGDQYCVINVGTTGVAYKALVIGSGRVIIRGNGAITTYQGTPASTPNLFTGVIYALNLQTADQTVSTPTRELVRIEKGARVKGAVHADGKNATIGLIAPDFDTSALVTGLLCPGALCALAPTLNGLLGTLGVSGTVNALINGTCLVSLPILGCTVSLPGLGLNSVVGGITAQLTTYGSPIHADVATINALSVFGASGVVPGSFQDLQP
jgi:Tfp pilus assembly protein PilX